MKFASLFTGIGGFDIGFSRAGMDCSWMCEIDKDARKVLASHWPAIKCYEDVRNVGSGCETVDLICGGFPCQDLSVAGKRAGLAGSRSGLWFEFERIITELRPKWVVIENVPGLLSSNRGRDFAIVIQGLANRGYGVAWRVLDSQYFGVAQRRRRVFIVGSLGSGRCAEVLFEREGLSRDSAPRREEGEEVATGVRTSPERHGGTAEVDGSPAFNVLGLSGNAKERHAYPTETARTLDTWTGVEDKNAGSTVVVAYNVHQNDDGRKDTALTIQTSGQGESKTLVMAHGQANAEITEDISPTLQLLHEQPILLANWQSGGGRMDDEIAASLRSSAEHSAQFVWQNRQQSGEVRVQDDTLPTMTKSLGTGGNNAPMVGARRLTPTECERLQGFPDGWTAGQSDSARYRQLGNAVTVNVIEWIGKRIMSYDNLVLD